MAMGGWVGATGVRGWGKNSQVDRSGRIHDRSGVSGTGMNNQFVSRIREPCSEVKQNQITPETYRIVGNIYHPPTA